MNAFKTRIGKRVGAGLLLAAVSAALLLPGCRSTTPPDSNMPWAQPAEWEKKDMLRKMGGAGY